MTVHTPGSQPVIPGYAVSVIADGMGLIAERLEPLTQYQFINGCRNRVTAEGPRELEMLCVAETTKAVLVSRAELLMQAARD